MTVVSAMWTPSARIVGDTAQGLDQTYRASDGLGEPQVNGEDRADPDLAIDLQEAAVPVDNVFDDRKPKPGAAETTRPGRIDAIEALRQSWQVHTRDTIALI